MNECGVLRYHLKASSIPRRYTFSSELLSAATSRLNAVGVLWYHLKALGTPPRYAFDSESVSTAT